MTPDDGSPASGGRGRENGEGGNDEGGNGGGSSSGPGGAALLEWVVVGASVLLIAVTLGFVLWQASVASEVATPTASIESVDPLSDGRLRVTVVLDNRRGPGLTSVQLAVRCGDTEHELAFEHVPAGGRRTGTVTCAPGTDPEAVVETWVTA